MPHAIGLAVHAAPGGEVAVSWPAFHRATGTLAAHLARRGVGHGDAVVAVGTSTYETLLLLFATWRCGAAISFVPATRAHGAPGLPDVLADRARQLGARAVCAPRRWWTEAGAGAGATGGAAGALPPATVRLDEMEVARRAFPIGPARGGRRGAAMAWPPADAAPGDVAIYQATSGTTGRQKLVPVTWAMLTRNLAAMADRWGLDETERFATWMPLYHDMGLVAFCALPAFVGARLTMVPTETFARAPVRFLRAAAAGRATMTGSPTFGLAMMERSLRRADRPLDLSTVVRIACGAEMIDLAVCERFLDAGHRHGLRPDVLAFAYGMAEATVAATVRPPSALADATDRSPAVAEGSAVAAGWMWPGAWGFARTGRPVDGVEVRVVGPDGAPAADAVVGEIAVRGPCVFGGYHADDAGPATGLDWFRTGDLGYLVAGELVVVGRTKDVVIVGGRNIVPDSVERVVGELPGVRTVAALPVRGEAGEGVGLLVERRPGSPTSARDVRAAVRRALGISPQVVRFVERGQLPRTTSGKLRRSACRALLPEASIDSRSFCDRSSVPSP